MFCEHQTFANFARLKSLLLQAHRDEYAALGFEVTDVQTIGTDPTSPTILPPEQRYWSGVWSGTDPDTGSDYYHHMVRLLY